MSIAAELGNRIRLYRKQLHLSQEGLAELCNFHPAYIGQLERGEKNATLESVYKLSRGLGVPMAKLLEDIDIVDSASDNIPLEVYRRLMQLPTAQQREIAGILTKIINLIQDAE